MLNRYFRAKGLGWMKDSVIYYQVLTISIHVETKLIFSSLWLYNFIELHGNLLKAIR